MSDLKKVESSSVSIKSTTSTISFTGSIRSKLDVLKEKIHRSNEQRKQNRMEQTSMRTITEYLALK
ncbi:hypothetical protein CORT_0B03430 [Candida orthopsilosis Co 90-125]|uniref:Uncharacterized protein n=1 Tax=Candida orthopsilosis (strain 90-125) TaxID=1136231 RepID=H8X111_CANO9|nr:hypothetical protein CORT_0B03430 [Candida orthopsilosis Co 90-125]CCG22051.1 hypothetical protein CORT_0B03430 [Candida orthopsilosis Co 90-125]